MQASRGLAGLWAGLWLGLAGCATSAPPEPVKLSEAGVRVRQGQGVWRVPARRLELAGELLLVLTEDGRGCVQFSKTPFTLVNARVAASRWQIEFSPTRRVHAGHGLPPRRFAWLHLLRALMGLPLGSEWELADQSEGRWRFSNRHTGECVEGYLSP